MLFSVPSDFSEAWLVGRTRCGRVCFGTDRCATTRPSTVPTPQMSSEKVVLLRHFQPNVRIDFAEVHPESHWHESLRTHAQPTVATNQGPDSNPDCFFLCRSRLRAAPRQHRRSLWRLVEPIRSFSSQTHSASFASAPSATCQTLSSRPTACLPSALSQTDFATSFPPFCPCHPFC